MFNKYWFRRFYTTEFIQVVRYYAESLRTKVVPSFDNISDEAALVEKETVDRLGQHFDPDRDDPSDCYETAHNAAVDFYVMASRIRQGIINMFAAGLYHLFEQQLLKLHRQELLSICEARGPIDADLLKLSVAKDRLSGKGINIDGFSSWGRIHNELRLVANTVKHADGRSCADLKIVRPELFIYPSSERNKWEQDVSQYQVVQPLAGEDLFITLEHFEEFVTAVKTFWEELADAVEALET